MSLRLVLVVPFVLQLVATVALVGYLSYKNSQQAVSDLAHQLMEEVGERISDRLKDYLRVPYDVVTMNRLAVEQGTLNLNHREQVRQQFWQQMLLHPLLANVDFASEQGEYLGYGRILSADVQHQVQVISGENLALGTAFLGEIKPAAPQQRQYFLVNAKGQPTKLIYTNIVNPHQLPWYRYAKAARTQTWTPILVIQVVPILAIWSVAPIYNEIGDFQGVLSANFRLSDISTYLNQLHFSPSGQTFILERSGDLVATSTLEIPYVAQLKRQPRRLQAINSRDPQTREITQQLIQQFGGLDSIKTTQQLDLVVNHQRRFVRISPYRDQRGLDWLVVIVVPESDFMTTIHHNTLTTTLLCVGALGLAIALGLFTAGKVTEPISRINRASRAMANGDLEHQLPTESSVSELEELAQSFNQMADQVRQSFGRIQTALETSEAKFATIFRTSPDPIAITTLAEGRILEANDRMLEFFGYSREELIGRTALELNLWANLEERHSVRQKLETEGKVLDQEATARLKSGAVKTVQVSAEVRNLEGQDCVIVAVKDISEAKREEAVRKAAELALQQSEARSRAILDEQTELISRFLPDSTLLFVNDAYCRYFGIRREEVIGKSFNPVIYEADQGIVAQLLASMTVANPTVIIENRVVVKGEIRWTQWVNQMFFDQQGNLTEFQSVGRDITDLKQIEAALRKSETNLLQAQRIAHVGSWEFDLTTQKITWSQELFHIFGLDPTQPEPTYPEYLQIQHPDDRPQLQAIVEQAIATGAPYEIEHRLIHPDGAIRYVLGRGEAVRDAQGTVIQLLGTALDITDRKQVEIALQASEARYRILSEVSPVGVFRFDQPLNCVYVNDRWCEMTGRPKESAMGRGWMDALHPEDREALLSQWAAGYAESHAGDLVFNHSEGRHLRPDGSINWYYVQVAPELDADGSTIGYIGTLTDITDLKAAEAALHQQAERERLLSQISQDIRQTLDLDQILQTSVNKVRQFLHTDRVVIYRFQPDWSGIIIAESVAAGWDSLLEMQFTDTFFVETQGHSYYKGFVKGTSDIYTANLDPCHLALLEQMQVRAKLMVPILQDAHLWGLLIAHHCRSPRHWQPLEIELQQHLATQIAIAIQQSQLYQQVQSLNTNLELQVQERTAQLQQALEFEALLKRITDRVRDSLDEGQILQTAVAELAQGLAVAACDTGIYNPEQTTSTIAYEFTHTLAPAQGQTFEIATAPHAEIYPQLLRGQICHFCDISPNPLRSDQQLLTTLAVPIVDDQGVLGDLWLFKSLQDEFNDQEVRLVQQVATQCAIALRQSRLYQAAQAQVQELERLSQLKDDFLSTVSHELRTPMSSIKMATKMLEISLDRLGVLADQSNAVHRYFKILRDEGQREVNLINDLLDLSRLDAGKEPLNLTSVTLQFCIPQLAETFLERTRSQQQQLILEIPEDLPPLTTQLSYLERALTELLNNACKYTPAGETITVSARSTMEFLEIRVSNSGVEIPAPECDRIFDKFYRIPNNDPWKHGGTGLGLALVKKLIEQMGGTIHIESGGGQTSFILELGLFA
ncbi:PAS domain S-box protein [Neosynechococcus sphagnicola]|uniref:PAS domain S-box protein n=1 Tax=Neosynechococcus sphagnicola TaxID=1501145 RepID=UPI0009DCB3C0|nr:PAS domain S-box protein [Neosynechococcus sphagnicola]